MDITQIGAGEAMLLMPDARTMGADLAASPANTSFSECISSQTAGGKETQKAPDNTAKESGTDAYDKYRYKNNDVEDAKQDTVSEKLSDAKEETDNFEKEVIETVSSQLGVDEEQVVGAMEVLGLTVLDLLAPQNLAELAKELTGMTDNTELLLHPEFKQMLSEVAALGKDFAAEIGTDVDALCEYAKELPKQESVITAEQPLVPEQEEAVTEEAVPQMPEIGGGQPAEEEPKLHAADAPETSQEPVITAEDRRTVRWEEEPKPQAEALAEEQPAQTPKTDIGLAAENEPQKRQPDNMMQERQTPGAEFAEHLASTLNEHLAEAAETSAVPQEFSYTSVDAYDIIRQIVETAKVVLDAESTSIEMQLNPENLGKIYLNLSSRDGAVSAQFYAQNEEVKAALEAQVVMLTENLNQGGIKVDSVEVAVATHEFERNLEQNAKGEEQQGERQEEKKASRRNLNLDSLDELAGLMTEEEVLAAQIMKDNGNSVDFSA